LKTLNDQKHPRGESSNTDGALSKQKTPDSNLKFVVSLQVSLSFAYKAKKVCSIQKDIATQKLLTLDIPRKLAVLPFILHQNTSKLSERKINIQAYKCKNTNLART